MTQMMKLVDHAFTSAIIKIRKNLKGKKDFKKRNMKSQQRNDNYKKGDTRGKKYNIKKTH